VTDESVPDPDEEIDRKRRAEQIRVALGTLPARERRILEMHYYAEMTFAEIGAAIGISAPRACRIHQRGLRMLSRVLGRAEPANDNADGPLADAEEEGDADVAPVSAFKRSASGGE
jgi:DNA-directed RNA polymerase specialized sigma24 family protein